MPLRALLLATLVTTAGWLGYDAALAQFGPPATVFGTVVDADGEVPAGLPVVAYIGDVICSIDDVVTIFTGDGNAEVAVYAIDVVADQQIAGCGTDGAAVRIKVGDRFADDMVLWRPGPIELSITFGDATPAAIPTFTPAAAATNTLTPLPATATATSAAETASPAGSPSPTPDAQATRTAQATPSPTLAGGATTNNFSPVVAADGGGAPIWVFGLVLVALIAIVGGSLGYLLSRSPGEEVPLPPEDGA